jgi:hypothetical protein
MNVRENPVPGILPNVIICFWYILGNAQCPLEHGLLYLAVAVSTNRR